MAITNYFQLDLGIFMIYSLIAAVPITISGLLYARWLGKKLFKLPAPENHDELIDRPYTEEELSSTVNYS